MFCIPANYSKFNPPLNPPGEPPAEVQIGLDNFEILKIDDREFTIEINAYFIVKWRDKRIEVRAPHPSLTISSTIEILTTIAYSTNGLVWQSEDIQVHSEAIDYHFSELGHDSTDWVPVELEMVERLWIPDAEILRLKGFRWVILTVVMIVKLSHFHTVILSHCQRNEIHWKRKKSFKS